VDEAFRSGLIVDGVIGFMAIEWIVLILVRNQGRPVFKPGALLVTLGAGAGLLLALRAALRGGPTPIVALWLVVALGFHVADLAMRWSMSRT
jgi:hypothetical protein